MYLRCIQVSLDFSLCLSRSSFHINLYLLFHLNPATFTHHSAETSAAYASYFTFISASFTSHSTSPHSHNRIIPLKICVLFTYHFIEFSFHSFYERKYFASFTLCSLHHTQYSLVVTHTSSTLIVFPLKFQPHAPPIPLKPPLHLVLFPYTPPCAQLSFPSSLSVFRTLPSNTFDHT